MKAVFVLAMCLLPVCLALPTGAPDEACADMTPKHGVKSQPLNTLPYDFACTAVDKNTIKFELKGNAQDTFRGVLVQVRDDKGTRVGKFVEIPEGYKLSCEDEAVTHMNEEKADRKSVTLTVKVDVENTPGARCWFTVVQVKQVFWAAVSTPVIIKYDNDVEEVEEVEEPDSSSEEKERKKKRDSKVRTKSGREGKKVSKKEAKKKAGKKAKKEAKKNNKQGNKKGKLAKKQRKQQKKAMKKSQQKKNNKQ